MTSKYNLKEITQKSEWNNFIINNFTFYSFLSSWEWAIFNELQGHKTFRFWIYEWNELIWVILLIKTVARRWTFFLSPHSPLIKWDYFSILNDILSDIVELAKKEKVDFLRINSISENTKENKKKYESLKFINAPMHAHVEDTHLLDITQTEEELLSKMRKTTRYIVKRAIKEWVEVKKDSSQKNINYFVKWHIDHANRANWKHTYHAFSASYIQNLSKAFWDKITYLNATYENYLEASLATIEFWKHCVYYLWVSDIKHPKFSPAYLLQWEAIKHAKKNWCTTYNFWWIAHDSNKKHPLYWPSLFKRWFWGDDYSLLHAQDYIFNYKYSINYIIETVRRLRRWYYFKKPE